MLSGEKDTAAYRAELARQQPSPEIYLASAIVDGSPPIWPGSIVVKKSDDARRSVDRIKASGADFIKVYTRVFARRILRAAHRSKTTTHRFRRPPPRLRHRPGSLERRSAHHGASPRHRRLLLQPAAIPEERSQPRRIFPRRFAVAAGAYRSIDQAKCQALFAQFRGNNTWQVPTLSVLRIWGLLNESKLTSDPRLACIGKKSRERWQERIQPQLRI
jgi:hypothetical protein